MSNKLIQIWLMGGLGNQLFQINKAYELREFGLDIKLVDNLIQQDGIFATKFLKWKIHQDFTDQVYKHDFEIITKKNLLPIILAKAKLFERYSSFKRSDFSCTHSKNMFGYFQKNVTIHLPIKNFTLKNQDPPEVMMHMRLTDNNNLYYSKKYYSKVLKNIINHKICIVTDDELNSEKFLEDNGVLNYKILSGTVKEDFSRLANAKLLICAPSTFSFWAAIANNFAQNIYVPKKFLEYIKKPPMNWIII